MLTNEQIKVLNEYGVYAGSDIDRVLDELDNKITEIGFCRDWQQLNADGNKLQRLYDNIFAQEDVAPLTERID